MATGAYSRRQSRPQTDPYTGAKRWFRTRSTEQDEYPIDIGNMLESGETVNSVTVRDRYGITIGTVSFTRAGVITVPVTAGIAGGLVLDVGTHREPTTLAQCISVLNYLRTAYTAHIADTDQHLNADTVNVVTAAVCTSFSTAVTLADDLKAQFNAHRPELGLGTPAHGIHDVLNVVDATSTPTTLATLITLVKDIWDNYIAHIDDTAYGYHSSAPDTTNNPSATNPRVVSVPLAWHGSPRDYSGTLKDYR